MTEQERLDEAFSNGWKAAIDHLQQGGVHMSSDFTTADGKCLGRFHGFFPAGATLDDKANYFEELAGWERALENAKPMSFGDATR